MIYPVYCAGCSHEFKFIDPPSDEAVVECYVCGATFVVSSSYTFNTTSIARADIRIIEESSIE